MWAKCVLTLFPEKVWKRFWKLIESKWIRPWIISIINRQDQHFMKYFKKKVWVVEARFLAIRKIMLIILMLVSWKHILLPSWMNLIFPHIFRQPVVVNINIAPGFRAIWAVSRACNLGHTTLKLTVMCSTAIDLTHNQFDRGWDTV